MAHGEAQTIINVIRQAVGQMTRKGAMVDIKRGIVHNGGAYLVSAYFDGESESAMTNIRMPAGLSVAAGDYVVVHSDGEGDAWVNEVMPTALYPKLAIDPNRGNILVGAGTAEPTAAPYGWLVYSGGSAGAYVAPPAAGGGSGHTHTSADDLLADDIDADSVDARVHTARGVLLTDPVFMVWYSADDVNTFNRWELDAGGGMWWGPSVTALDTRLRRSGVKTLTIDDGAGGAATVNVIGTLQEDGTQVSVVGHTHTLDFGEVGDITTQAFGDAAAAGATGEVADAGHKHAMPANPVTAHVAAVLPHPNVIAILYDEAATDSYATGIGSLSDVPFVGADMVLNLGGFTFVDVDDGFTVPTSGYYYITGWVKWTNHATGVRRIGIRVNGTNKIEDATANGVSTGTASQIQGYLPLVAGDLITMHIAQSSGGNLTITSKQLTAQRIS